MALSAYSPETTFEAIMRRAMASRTSAWRQVRRRLARIHLGSAASSTSYSPIVSIGLLLAVALVANFGH
jgi:hypothetical protein